MYYKSWHPKACNCFELPSDWLLSYWESQSEGSSKQLPIKSQTLGVLRFVLIKIFHLYILYTTFFDSKKLILCTRIFRNLFSIFIGKLFFQVIHDLPCKAHVFWEGHKNRQNFNLTVCSNRQIDGEDFVNFCSLLRKHELYGAKFNSKLQLPSHSVSWDITLLIYELRNNFLWIRRLLMRQL